MSKYNLVLTQNHYKLAYLEAKKISDYLQSEDFKDLLDYITTFNEIDFTKINHIQSFIDLTAKIDVMFKQIITLTKLGREPLKNIGTAIINLEKQFLAEKDRMKGLVEANRLNWQRLEQERIAKEKEELIAQANNLDTNIIEEDRIQEEQERVLETIEKVDKDFAKQEKRFIKEKITNDQIIIKGFAEDLSTLELFDLYRLQIIKIDEAHLKKLIKLQLEESDNFGFKGIIVEVKR